MGIYNPDPRRFMERNAGKLLILALLAPIPLRIIARNLGALDLMLVAEGLFVLLITLAVIGYIQRRKRKRERRL